MPTELIAVGYKGHVFFTLRRRGLFGPNHRDLFTGIVPSYAQQHNATAKVIGGKRCVQFTLPRQSSIVMAHTIARQCAEDFAKHISSMSDSRYTCRVVSEPSVVQGTLVLCAPGIYPEDIDRRLSSVLNCTVDRETSSWPWCLVRYFDEGIVAQIEHTLGLMAGHRLLLK